MADAQSDWTDSLVTPNGQSFKLDMQKQVDIQNKKIAKLEKKLVEFELNEDKLKSQLAVKDDTILSLQENVKSLKKEYTSGWDSQKGNIENITSLEAQLRYKEIEV